MNLIVLTLSGWSTLDNSLTVLVKKPDPTLWIKATSSRARHICACQALRVTTPSVTYYAPVTGMREKLVRKNPQGNLVCSLRGNMFPLFLWDIDQSDVHAQVFHFIFFCSNSVRTPFDESSIMKLWCTIAPVIGLANTLSACRRWNARCFLYPKRPWTENLS